MAIALEPVFNWDKLREDVNAYLLLHGINKQGFAHACDIDPTQMHKISSFATTGALALMTLYKITNVLGTAMESYIIDNRLK